MGCKERFIVTLSGIKFISILWIVLIVTSCDKKKLLEGNWYVESPGDTPLHYLSFKGDDFLLMDILGYTEKGTYKINKSNICLKFEDGTLLDYPIEIISEVELLILDSINIYKEEIVSDFSSPYKLINIETSKTFTYQDLPMNYADIHLYRNDSLKIILGQKESSINEISLYLIRGHKRIGECILFVGENVTLEDYKDITMKFYLLGINQLLLVTSRDKSDKSRYFGIYEKYKYWSNEIEDYGKITGIPPPMFADQFASRDIFIENGGVITMIKSLNDYYIWKSSRVIARKQVLLFGKMLTMEDYIYIKDDLSKFIFWERSNIVSVIE